jgi:hypothetical protein
VRDGTQQNNIQLSDFSARVKGKIAIRSADL